MSMTTKAEFLFLSAKLEETSLESERADMLAALSTTGDASLLLSLLDSTLEGSQPVRRQDAAVVYDVASRTKEGR